jgi:hypothetical protein
LEIIQNWLANGILDDPFEEFFITRYKLKDILDSMGCIQGEKHGILES